jgi:hypothetical protein
VTRILDGRRRIHVQIAMRRRLNFVCTHEHAEDNVDFSSREVLARTHSPPGSKAKMGLASRLMDIRSLLIFIGEEAVGSEVIGIGVTGRVSVNRPEFIRRIVPDGMT